VATARRNAEHLGLADRATFVEGHWGRGQVEHYNLIVSNPPYIRTTDLDSLPRNVIGYDPVLALDGGADGLDCFRALAPDAARLLESGGTLIVEIGVGQESAVEAILMQETLVPVARRRDLGGRVRCISARKSHSI
jgi:release factor glutamine methyltransferase